MVNKEHSLNRQPESPVPLAEVGIGDTFYTYYSIDHPDRPKPVYQKVCAKELDKFTRRYDVGVAYRLVGFLMSDGSMQENTPIADWHPSPVIYHYRDGTLVIMVQHATPETIDRIEEEATADLRDGNAVKTIKNMLNAARSTIHMRMKQPDFKMERPTSDQPWSSITEDVVFQFSSNAGEHAQVWRRDGNDAVSIAPTLQGWDCNLSSPQNGVLQMMRQMNVRNDTPVIVVGRKNERGDE